MASEDGNLHVVVNGEFYDFENTRTALKTEGFRFHTESDSEILLPLYQKHGVQSLNHLRGEFAFVLWDSGRRQLFAARDRFGIKPLYYTRIGGRLHFASEIKALLAAGAPPEWDWETVHQVHSIWAHPPDRTLFRNIFQVPPAHYVVATANEFKVLPYWDFNFPTQIEAATNPAGEPEPIARVREKLHEAVRLRLRADVPVGCYLSGGLDSCAILGIASLYSPRPIRAFTLAFDDPAYDESKIAEAMAQHAGAQFNLVPVKSADFSDHFNGALYSGETLIYNPSVVSKYILSRHVREAGLKVVLTGEGADEIFGGYAHFRKDMFRHLYTHDPAELQRQLDALYRNNSISHGTLLSETAPAELAPLREALGFVPTFLEAPAQYIRESKKFFSPGFRTHFHARNAYADFIARFDIAGQLADRHPVDQSLYLWSRTTLPNYLLSQLGDRMEMAHSVEGRLPFLDHELVELVTKIPVALKIRGSSEKHVLREAVRDVVTDPVYRRQKHPFMAPPATRSSASPFFQFMQETLRGRALKNVPFYDAREIEKLLDLLPAMDAAGRERVDPLLMTFLSIAKLQEIFHIGQG